MKKLLISFILVSLLVFFWAPHIVMAAGPLVTCGNDGQDPCTLLDLFGLIASIYNFLVIDIATPLAALMIMIGGILLIISGGNPGLASRGKDILKYSIIAVILIWGAWLIINTVLNAIGYTGKGNWFSPF